MTSPKPDCYACRYRRPIPGDAHSSCAHPSVSATLDSPVGKLLTLMGKGAGTVSVQNGLAVGNAHGIEHGWFNWPFNYDPVWLVACGGFKEGEGVAPEEQHPFVCAHAEDPGYHKDCAGPCRDCPHPRSHPCHTRENER